MTFYFHISKKCKLDAGGKPSTKFPPEGLVEHISILGTRRDNVAARGAKHSPSKSNLGGQKIKNDKNY